MIPLTGQPVTLRARHILPMHGPAIEGGWLRIEHGRITEIGSCTPPEPVHDLGDAIILPGLVNAHTHLEFSDLAEPLDATGGLPAWIERVVQLRRSRPADDTANAARHAAAVAAGLAESAASGVTAIGEIATVALPAGDAKGGPRVRTYHEGLGLSAAAIAQAESRIARATERASASDVRAGLSPHAPYSVAAPLGQWLLDRAGQHRLPVAMHIAESAEEAELLSAGTGPFRDLLERLGAWQVDDPPSLRTAEEWIGWLALAPRGIVVHGTYLPADPAAMAALSRHRRRLAVAICPRTTRLISGGLPPVAAFRTAGLRVAIGTDSRASNPDLSVLTECRTLVDAGLASPEEALLMATQHGAWALMFEHRCGLLAPGRPADLAILRPATPTADPFTADPFTAALDPATHVIATMRAGQWLFRSR